jgi:hypothetical protein
MDKKLSANEKRARERSSGREVRLALGYCRRCGSLRVFPQDEQEEMCPACRKLLAWAYGSERAKGVPAARPAGEQDDSRGDATEEEQEEP